MKGISKGLNKYISSIFVAKEEEMEIGGPTDVKHVSHIGFDSSSGGAPSWMNKLDTGPDFTSSSIAANSILQPCSSRDIDDSVEQEGTEGPPAKAKKIRHKKKKSSTASSPRAGGVKPKSSRKTKSKLIEGAKEVSVH